MLAGLVFCEMLSQYPRSAFQGSPRSAAVCDPNPPRSFARSKTSGRPSKSAKSVNSKHLGVDIHDPNARTSMTLGLFK